MKSILIVCDQPHIDVSLRRSLGHLLNSCDIAIASNGYQAFEELAQKTFELIIIDSEITGIDSLELVESVEYTDPGVPVILMLNQAHKSLWGPARRLNANPILRPFKPITFLRLIDTLLHEHLEHYRQLAETLKSILENLSVPIQAPITFLVDNVGEPLISAGEVENDLLEGLGDLAIRTMVTKRLPDEDEAQGVTLLAQNDTDKDHELYLTNVTEKLYLALIFPTTGSPLTSVDIWQWIDATAKVVRTAFLEAIPEKTTTNLTGYKNGKTGQNRIVIPLKLDSVFIREDGSMPQEETQEEAIPINWGFVAESSNVLDRLQNFC